MGSGDFRKFKNDSLHHVFVKGINGNVIFYSIEDCLVFFTLYSCLAREFNIKPISFCIMPNHIHSDELAQDYGMFIKFHMLLESRFAMEYNSQHNRVGQLFNRPFGYAPKSVLKKVRDSISYIANNPVVGKLSKSVLAYRWNLLAYCQSSHPFSPDIPQSKYSRKLRRSIKLVLACREKNQHLKYSIQKICFAGLSKVERAILTDFIISTYNCMDYEYLLSLYNNDFKKMVAVLDTNSGSEHDLKEDYEDYGKYQDMITETSRMGIKLSDFNFKSLKSEVQENLRRRFAAMGIGSRQISKFSNE